MVGIIIVTHNAAQFIEECLESVYSNSYNHIRVIIIDNASTDNTISIIEKKFPKATVIRNKRNEGYAVANNIGISRALKEECAYILLLNPDTTIDTECITELLRPFENNPTVGITGSIITYYDQPRKVWFGGGYFNRTFCYTRHRHMNELLPLHRVSQKIDFITGCCLMIKRKVIEEVGLLDTTFSFYFEDLDICLRAKEAGYDISLVPLPLVRHRVSVSAGSEGSNALTPFRAYYFGRNPFIIIKKHMKGVRLITGVIGQFAIRLPYYAIKMFRTGNVKSYSAYVRGMKHGLF